MNIPLSNNHPQLPLSTRPISNPPPLIVVNSISPSFQNGCLLNSIPRFQQSRESNCTVNLRHPAPFRCDTAPFAILLYLLSVPSFPSLSPLPVSRLRHRRITHRSFCLRAVIASSHPVHEMRAQWASTQLDDKAMHFGNRDDDGTVPTRLLPVHDPLPSSA